MNIYFDIETIPSQDPVLVAEIQQRCRDMAEAEAALVTPPASYKQPEAIAKWWGESGNQRKESILAGAELKAQEEWRATALDGATGQIVVIGVAINDESPVPLYLPDWKRSEAHVLKEFFSIVTDACSHTRTRPCFIGHNVTGFDLRFIYQRAVVLGIRPPAHIPFKAKPWDDVVFDTMQQWDQAKRASMNKLCRAFGLADKGDLDGSMVWDYVRDGRIAEVAQYCVDDVNRARIFHKRMTFAFA
jgi:predicted PolB exonuclease-like 3'-5' exonuclease